jgi:hypothetical protein
MQNPETEKISFRRFLIYFCSWNFLLDLGSLTLLAWFATFIENAERVAGYYFLILGMCALAIVRSSYYFILLIVKFIKKRRKQFFFLLAGFFVELIILAGFWMLLIYVLASATLSIGPLH